MAAEAAVAVRKAPRRPRKLAAVPDTGYLPRVAPPLPKTTAIAELRKAAKLAGIKMYPWQDVAGQYMTATRRGKWLFPEYAAVVARQNGKTDLLIPRIVMGLLRGERIMHTAQDRTLPRLVFERVVDVAVEQFRSSLKAKPRLANGTEQIRMLNGGSYRIVAPTRSGARGGTNDLVIIDEARESTDYAFVAAAEPTLTVSPSPQIIYLSNAGTEESVVLNAIRKRADSDRSLGYLEWSAHPDRPIDDRTGWHEANPALAGGLHARQHMEFLERMYLSYTADNQGDIFETEHLCRWVASELPRVVSELAWDRAGAQLSPSVRPAMGIAQDPSGRRASAVLAWTTDGVVNIEVLADVDGYPVDLEALAEQVTQHSRRRGVRDVAYDAWMDRDFARYFRTSKKDPIPMQAADWEAACERFVRMVDSGMLRHDGSPVLTADMAHTVRRSTPHGWVAIRASDDRATTSSLAAIRAVWLATNPARKPPRVY